MLCARPLGAWDLLMSAWAPYPLLWKGSRVSHWESCVEGTTWPSIAAKDSPRQT